MGMNNLSAGDGIKIDPTVDTDLDGKEIKALSCENSGILDVTWANSGKRDTIPVFSGYNPIRVKKIWAAGSSITGLVIALKD